MKSDHQDVLARRQMQLEAAAGILAARLQVTERGDRLAVDGTNLEQAMCSDHAVVADHGIFRIQAAQRVSQPLRTTASETGGSLKILFMIRRLR